MAFPDQLSSQSAHFSTDRIAEVFFKGCNKNETSGFISSCARFGATLPFPSAAAAWPVGPGTHSIPAFGPSLWECPAAPVPQRFRSIPGALTAGSQAKAAGQDRLGAPRAPPGCDSPRGAGPGLATRGTPRSRAAAPAAGPTVRCGQQLVDEVAEVGGLGGRGHREGHILHGEPAGTALRYRLRVTRSRTHPRPGRGGRSPAVLGAEPRRELRHGRRCRRHRHRARVAARPGRAPRGTARRPRAARPPRSREAARRRLPGAPRAPPPRSALRAGARARSGGAHGGGAAGAEPRWSNAAPASPPGPPRRGPGWCFPPPPPRSCGAEGCDGCGLRRPPRSSGLGRVPGSLASAGAAPGAAPQGGRPHCAGLWLGCARAVSGLCPRCVRSVPALCRSVSGLCPGCTALCPGCAEVCPICAGLCPRCAGLCPGQAVPRVPPGVAGVVVSARSHSGCVSLHVQRHTHNKLPTRSNKPNARWT